MADLSLDAWMWFVEYADGGTFVEYGDAELAVSPLNAANTLVNGPLRDERGWAQALAVADASRTRILTIALWPLPGHLHRGVQFVIVPHGAQPVFFRRRSIAVESGARSTVTCIGYEWPDGDPRPPLYRFCFDAEPGRVIETTDRDAVQA